MGVSPSGDSKELDDQIAEFTDKLIEGEISGVQPLDSEKDELLSLQQLVIALNDLAESAQPSANVTNRIREVISGTLDREVSETSRNASKSGTASLLERLNLSESFWPRKAAAVAAGIAAVILVILFAPGLFSSTDTLPGAATGVSAATIGGLAIATIIPLLVLYGIFKLDLYSSGSFQFVVVSFIWGMISFGLASFFNSRVVALGLVSAALMIQLIAPISEELFKSLILFYLVRRPEFTYFVDGAIFGFAIGIGFAILENYEYVLSNPDAAVGVAFSRVISTNLIHGVATATVGIAFGLARFESGGRRALTIVMGFLAAMALHIGFNNLVTRVTAGPLLLYAAAVGIIGLGLIWYAIRRGLAEEKLWIEEMLTEADRVTEEEESVVLRMSDIDTILDPIEKRFGEAKAEEIEEFLLLQAELGIMKKSLEKLPPDDEDLRRETQEEINELQINMRSSRQKVGPYPMMFLRGIFPDDDDPLWERLKTKVDKRVAEQPAAQGGGLWGKLDELTEDGDELDIDVS